LGSGRAYTYSDHVGPHVTYPFQLPTTLTSWPGLIQRKRTCDWKRLESRESSWECLSVEDDESEKQVVEEGRWLGYAGPEDTGAVTVLMIKQKKLSRCPFKRSA